MGKTFFVDGENMIHTEDAISAVAVNLNMPKHVVDRVYWAYWKAIRQHITSIPMIEELADDEFLSYRPNGERHRSGGHGHGQCIELCCQEI